MSKKRSLINKYKDEKGIQKPKKENKKRKRDSKTKEYEFKIILSYLEAIDSSLRS